MNGTGKKVILRDTDWLRTQRQLDSSAVLRELKAKAGDKALVVDLQDLNKPHGGRLENALMPCRSKIKNTSLIPFAYSFERGFFASLRRH
jgi:hypothetical protein